jgi:hypothetical protein
MTEHSICLIILAGVLSCDKYITPDACSIMPTGLIYTYRIQPQSGNPAEGGKRKNKKIKRLGKLQNILYRRKTQVPATPGTHCLF